MEFSIGQNLIIWQQYNPMELSVIFSLQGHWQYSQELMMARLLGYNPTKIQIGDSWYDVIPLHELYYKRNEDGYYRFIYIQINMSTFEYYIGKVNRKRWSELKRYQGSGIRFKNKYAKCPGDFVRYYIAACTTAAETEKLESSIVNDDLLKDPFCLNLVRGGGGTTTHRNRDEQREQQKRYMAEHPEQYQSMIQTAKQLYCSGETYALSERNRNIKETMSAPSYKEMTRTRIKKWKLGHPEEYERARKNNRIAIQTKESKNKRKQSRERWIQSHPEEHTEHMLLRIAACQTDAAKEKRKHSLKEWNASHPEEAKANSLKRSMASAQKCQKAVNMLDLQTGEIVRCFESQHAAAEWLVSQGIAKNRNCVSSISAVCLKKPCSTGYGFRKKAYGFGWEFKQK